MVNRELFWGLMIPFIGTSAGAACVFFMKDHLGSKVQKALTGFASGVMTAASIWSLIIPAMDQSTDLGRWAFAPAVGGFWLGILFLLLLDHIIPHRGDQRLFWDQTNWESLCKGCHDKKTGSGL